MRRLAIVRHRFVGFHNWPDAPEKVAFLRHEHRHEFHVELAVEQAHSDRDVEFTLLKTELQRMIMLRYCRGGYVGIDIGSKSCEMIAEEIIAWAAMHKYRVAYCEVFEDGENGARVEPEPEAGAA